MPKARRAFAHCVLILCLAPEREPTLDDIQKRMQARRIRASPSRANSAASSEIVARAMGIEVAPTS